MPLSTRAPLEDRHKALMQVTASLLQIFEGIADAMASRAAVAIGEGKSRSMLQRFKGFHGWSLLKVMQFLLLLLYM